MDTSLQKQNNVSDRLWEALNINEVNLQDLKIVESSIYLTRRCNLSCQYCKIIKTQFSNELTIGQWKDSLKIMESLGIRFVNIAGGEPTILPWLGELISFINKETSMEYSIVSNSTFNDDKLDEITGAGLKTYVASIDGLDEEDQGLAYLKKSSAGLNMLDKLKERDVPNLCGNIVITPRNIDNVMDVVNYLNDRGYWTNICPIIWGKGDKWEKIEIMDESYRLTDQHQDKMIAISDELISMKSEGAMILPTDDYLRNMSTYGIWLNWKCFNDAPDGAPPRLIVDADGAVMDCINVRGDTSSQYNIFDFKNPHIYKEYIAVWEKNVSDCSGCYWSTMYTAKERQQMLSKVKLGLNV